MPERPTPDCILIPVHNRRAVTLAALRALQAEGVYRWAVVIVIDDGSTDGTSEAVRAEMPETILLHGDGNLWWTGAIELGMRHAIGRSAPFIFWLNDDSLPQPGALAFLREESARHGAIAGGVTLLPADTSPAYGGLHKGTRRLIPLASAGDATVRCDALHGNLVCIPASVVRTIGYPDARGLPHGYGDFDYTLRASTAGIPVLLVGRARATAEPNLSLNYRSWLLSDVPAMEWWRQLVRRGSYMNWRTLWRFYSRHWGISGALYCIGQLVKLTLVTVLRGLVPLAWLRRIYGGKSAAWRHEQKHRAAADRASPQP